MKGMKLKVRWVVLDWRIEDHLTCEFVCIGFTSRDREYRAVAPCNCHFV